MGAEKVSDKKSVSFPRPGHADLTGGMKYNHTDLRNVLERASARETAARVAVGALVSQVLEPFNIEFKSRVVRIGEVEDATFEYTDEFYGRVKESPVGTGFDALKEEYVDMVAAGILDPAKVTRSALQNATSVASTLLTTESVVASIKEDTPAMPAGGAGMGMM